MKEIKNNETKNKTEAGKMTDTKRVRTEKEECFDYHQEYFNTRSARDERIIQLINEDCRIEKGKNEFLPGDAYFHRYIIGVFIPV